MPRRIRSRAGDLREDPPGHDEQGRDRGRARAVDVAVRVLQDVAVGRVRRERTRGRTVWRTRARVGRSRGGTARCWAAAPGRTLASDGERGDRGKRLPVEERERQREQDHHERDDHRVEALGEEPARATRSTLPSTRLPSATTDGITGEPVVERRDLRHRACRACARPHRDAEVGVLERQNIVHTITAGHRDDVAAASAARPPSRASAPG